MPPADVIWIENLGTFVASKIGAHLDSCLLAIGELISYLVRRTQKVEDYEVALRGHLDATLTRAEELEEVLKAVPLSRNEAIARA